MNQVEERQGKLGGDIVESMTQLLSKEAAAQTLRFEQIMDVVASRDLEDRSAPQRVALPQQPPAQTKLDEALRNAEEQERELQMWNARYVCKTRVMVAERQRMWSMHRSFGLLKEHTKLSVLDEMNKAVTGKVKSKYSTAELMGKVGTWAEHDESHGEPDYSLCRTVFDADCNLIESPPAKPLHGKKEKKSKEQRRAGSDKHVPWSGAKPASKEETGLAPEEASVKGTPMQGTKLYTNMPSTPLPIGGSDDEENPEDLPRGTPSNAKVGLSVRDLVDVEADDGEGNEDDEEDARSSDYESHSDEELLSEKDYPLPPKHHLHSIGESRIKASSDWAVGFLEQLRKANGEWTSLGKIKPSTQKGLTKAWEKKVSIQPLNEKQQRLLDEWNEEASMEGKHSARRRSMEEMECMVWDYWSPSTMAEPRCNIFLKKEKTVWQAINIVRSKLTYEARLLKTRGTECAWHGRARPFFSGSVDVERLATFAGDICNLYLGDADAEDEEGFFPNDPQPTHNGLSKNDYCRRMWKGRRRFDFNAKGHLMVKPAKAVKKVRIAAKEKSGSEGEYYSSDGGDSSDPSKHEVDLAISSDEGSADEKRGNKKKMRKRRESAGETKLRKQLAEKEAAAAELRTEVKIADGKLPGKNRQELPKLVMTREEGYKSGKNFRTLATGNRYTHHRVIGHLVGMGEKDGGGKVSKNGTAVGKMMNKVQSAYDGELRDLRDSGEITCDTNDDEWAEEVMERFWAKYAKRFGEGPPVSRLEARQDVWRLDWAAMRFWYGHSPEDGLDMLEEMQAEAIDLQIVCTHKMVKKKFNDLCLPKTTSFTTGKPPEIERIMKSDKEELTPLVLEGWYESAGLRSDLPLTHQDNRSILPHVCMDPDKDTMLNAKGKMGAVGKEWRVGATGVRYGLSEGSRRQRNRNGNKSGYQMAGSEKEAAAAEHATDSGLESAAAEVDVAKLRKQLEESNVPKETREEILSGLQQRGERRGSQGRREEKPDFTEGGKFPWRERTTAQDHAEHYKEYPGDNKCPFHAVQHNSVAFRAQMKKVGMDHCPCISGCDIDTGRLHEGWTDWTAIATPKERLKVWEAYKKIEEKYIAADDKGSVVWSATKRERSSLKKDIIDAWRRAKNHGIDSAAVQMEPAVAETWEEAALALDGEALEGEQEHEVEVEDVEVEAAALESNAAEQVSDGEQHGSGQCLDYQWVDGEVQDPVADKKGAATLESESCDPVPPSKHSRQDGGATRGTDKGHGEEGAEDPTCTI